MRTLPAWDDSISDGCTVMPIGPIVFRTRFNLWFFARVKRPWAVRMACIRHDRAHYYGGSKQDRLDSDYKLMDEWQEAGISKWKRTLAWRLIRVIARPGSKLPGVSWAFGGGRYQYDDEPARGIEPDTT